MPVRFLPAGRLNDAFSFARSIARGFGIFVRFAGMPPIGAAPEPGRVEPTGGFGAAGDLRTSMTGAFTGATGAVPIIFLDATSPSGIPTRVLAFRVAGGRAPRLKDAFAFACSIAFALVSFGPFRRRRLPPENSLDRIGSAIGCYPSHVGAPPEAAAGPFSETRV